MAGTRLDRTSLTKTLCLAALVVFAAAAEVHGQKVRTVADPRDGAAKADLEDNVFMRADRLTLQRLEDAQRLLSEHRIGEAVRYEGDILEGKEDFFLQPDKNSPVYRSLKTEVQRLIMQMPPEGRELYELQYGARARSALEEALHNGDAARLAEVSRQFFCTRSGQQAAFLLGLDHFDHGRFLAAALSLRRLRDAAQSAAEDFEPALSLTMAASWLRLGMTEKTQESLASLRQRLPAARLMVAGREVPMFSGDADGVEWLKGLTGYASPAAAPESEDWRMFRGDPARNATADGGTPLLNLRWRVPLTDDASVGSDLDQWERWHAGIAAPALPAFHPLAVGDVLLMRTLQELLAIDFATGKRIWAAPRDQFAETAGNDHTGRQPMQLTPTERRLWNDLTYGTLSSDGRRVFSIEDSGNANAQGATGRQPMNPFLRGGIGWPVAMNDQPPPANRLVACELRSGKVKWHLEGGADQGNPLPAGTFFLGPPLPLMGQLYVLTEVAGEIQLLALDAASGKILWSQQLAVPEQGILADPLRGLSGASPSYADGVLVCPTSAGALVAVNLASQSLLWGYQFSPYATRGGRRMAPMLAARAGRYGGSGVPGWSDAEVCIVNGHVLATPLESDSLHCLRLSDGEPLWKCARQDDLYVACADREKVVLVGRRAVRAVRLADGKPAWDGRTVELPATPSGRGFLADKRYFLPLSSAEVASIDLAAGKIVQVSKSRKGDVPGNLICYRGKVISLGAQGMEAYYQLDAALAEIGRRLDADPNDAEALSLRGETRLDAGKPLEAIADFRRAYQLKADLKTRGLLRDTLLEGLQADFAAYRDRHDEIQRLLDDPVQQATFLRLMVRGLQTEGESASAFDYCQKLIDLDPQRLPLDQISKVLFVRRDRWIQNQLALLRGEGNDDAVVLINAAAEARLKAAAASASIDRLQQYLSYFGNLPVAAPARSELISRSKAPTGFWRPSSCCGATRRPPTPPIGRRPRPGWPSCWARRAAPTPPHGATPISAGTSPPSSAAMAGPASNGSKPTPRTMRFAPCSRRDPFGLPATSRPTLAH